MNLVKATTLFTLFLCTGSCLAQAPLPGAPTPGDSSTIVQPPAPAARVAPPYAGGQPVSPGAPPYAGGQPVSPGAPPYAGGQPVLPGAPPGASPIPGTNSMNYRRLPINYQGAAVRLEELRNLMPNIRPKEFQDMINDYLDWVGDLADGHWRIHQSFAKVDSMKDRADSEKQTTLKFSSLKRQAMLLKAEFLIKENRQPEALQPLVEIVVAEPKTQTGDSAYSLLKQIGFSEEPVSNPVSAAPPKPVSDAPAESKPTLRPAGKTAAR